MLLANAIGSSTIKLGNHSEHIPVSISDTLRMGVPLMDDVAFGIGIIIVGVNGGSCESRS